MPNPDAVLDALSKSTFRARFQLRGKELAYLHEKGIDTVLAHARDLLSTRLAPAFPANDGKQTPTKNHPVFVAQHATATCCRGCLSKWHDIPKGQALTDEQMDYVVTVIAHWLEKFSP